MHIRCNDKGIIDVSNYILVESKYYLKETTDQKQGEENWSINQQLDAI